MRRFRGIRTALVLCLGVQNTQGRAYASSEEACLNPSTKQPCSNAGFCRESYDYGGLGDIHECHCYAYHNQPTWYGPNEWSNNTEYHGISGQWCQCNTNECPRNLTEGGKSLTLLWPF